MEVLSAKPRLRLLLDHLARVTAIRSFFRFAAYEMPTHSAQIQRVLAMPAKRFDRKLIDFMTRPEVDALLNAPDKGT
jgi:site-specific recombinase XerD